MNVRTSAPGKVILSGEYAVLDGAPAVVMAVDRRARVSVSAGSGDWHRVSAPGLFEGDFEATLREIETFTAHWEQSS